MKPNQSIYRIYSADNEMPRLHFSLKRRCKIKKTKGEELENKMALIRALQQPDETSNLSSILIKGAKLNCFTLIKAAIRAIDPILKVYKDFFDPPLTTVKEEIEKYKQFFRPETYKRVRASSGTLIEQLEQELKDLPWVI